MGEITPGEPSIWQPTWAEQIPAQQWAVYLRAIEALRSTRLPFMLGGGFALGAYVDRWRNTKDIDFYILPQTQELMAEALTNAGFADYYEQLPYDRGWIHRSTRDGVIVDLIWSMANRRAQVDTTWFEHAQTVALREETLRLIPAEELLWCKLYVFQRDHCDWPDVLNLLHAVGPSLDWPRLLGRMDSDLQLLKAALTLFDWISPNRSAQLPAHIRRQLELPNVLAITAEEEQRLVRLLDSRGWYVPMLAKGAPLEV